MRKKIVLKRKTTPKVVTLTNGTTFTARYERISRKNLPTNIKVKKTRTIGPRTQRKKVRFTSSRSLRERLRKIQRVTTCTNWWWFGKQSRDLRVKLGEQSNQFCLGQKTDKQKD